MSSTGIPGKNGISSKLGVLPFGGNSLAPYISTLWSATLEIKITSQFFVTESESLLYSGFFLIYFRKKIFLKENWFYLERCLYFVRWTLMVKQLVSISFLHMSFFTFERRVEISFNDILHFLSSQTWLKQPYCFTRQNAKFQSQI